MDLLIKDLKHKLNIIQNKTESEENLKIHVTTWLLGELGYNTDDFDYEYGLCRRGKDRHADIYIPVNGIQKLQIGYTDWSAFNLQTVRASLIIKMHEAGCSLEEISYLTGAPISGMLQPDIINDESIKKAGEKSWKNGTKSGQSKHPFNQIFNP